jgi:hypothetical protein
MTWVLDAGYDGALCPCRRRWELTENICALRPRAERFFVRAYATAGAAGNPGDLGSFRRSATVLG